MAEEVENFILRYVRRELFTYPAEVSRLLGFSWHKANKILSRLRKRGILHMRRAGRIKIFLQAE